MSARRSASRFQASCLALLFALAACARTASAQPPAVQPAEDERQEAALADLLDKQQFDQAVDAARTLLASRQAASPKNAGAIADAFVYLARAHAGAGHAAEAASAYGEAIEREAAVLGPDDATVADVLNEAGIIHYQQADYAAAQSAFERALAIRERTAPESAEAAEAINNLAQVLQQSGDYQGAEPLLEQALALYEKTRGKDHGDVAIALNNLASLYRVKGDYGRAEPLYRRAIAIAEKTEGADGLNTARMLNNLGLMLRDAGSLDAAQPLLERSLSIREHALGSANPDVARVLNNLGIVRQELGDVPGAEALYRRALAGAEPALGPRHPLVAQIVNNLAVTQLLEGRYADAGVLYERAVRTRREALGSEHPDLAAALASQAVFFELTGHLADAVRAQQEATDISEHNLALVLATGSEAQKLSYVTSPSFQEETDITVSLNRRAAPGDRDATRLALTTVLRRKGRVLDAVSQSLQAVRNQLGDEEQAWLDRLAAVRAAQSRLVLRGPGTDAAAHDADLARLDQEAQQLERQISERSRAYRERYAAVTIDAVQRTLAAGEVLVEYVQYRPFDPRTARRDRKFGPSRYAAFVLASSGDPVSIDLGEATPIEAEVNELRRALRDPQDPTARERGRAVYDHLIGPLPAQARTATALFIAPDAVLNLLPFAALLDHDGHYLLERQTQSYLTSGRDLLRDAVNAAPRDPVLIVANPQFDRTEASSGTAAAANPPGTRSADLARARFPPLPGTAGEAAALATLLPGARVLTGATATERAIKATHGPRLLHVATHGFFLDGDSSATSAQTRQLVHDEPSSSVPAGTIENPLLRSGLALAGANQREGGDGEDGILTALEVTAVDLWGTRLAVLSACETGVGEVRRGDSVYGLRRALVMAGAESQLMTLWQVSDLATRDLMTAYYGELLAGRGRADALRTVQLAMLHDPKRAHPYYWASFILSGAAGPM